MFAGQKNDLRASGSGQSSPESQNHGTIRNWEVALSLFPQPARLTELAITYAAAGQGARARTLLRGAIADREGYVPPYWIAVAYLFLGEKDNAVQWLQRACRKNDPTLGWMKVDPMLDSIRSDQRYVELLRIFLKQAVYLCH